jgi:protein-S-isoprenylcysteine O-methyltransferase Ste14
VALRDELEQSGVWLFRWRGYLPLLLFVPVLAGLSESATAPLGSRADVIWEVFCLAIGLLGLGIRVATVGRVPAGSSGRQTAGGPKASKLSTTGMYSVVRHPLYLGNYFQWLGVAMLPRNPWVAITVSLAFWVYYERIMFAEEEHLRRTFGEEFEEWASRTPAFIPDFARWVPAALPFCWRTAVKRENSGMFAMVAALAFVSLVQDAVVERRFLPDPFWTTTFLLCALTYVALTVVARRTNLLRVPGR